MCFTESIAGPGQVIDHCGVHVILTCIEEQLNTLQRKEDINWLARTVQDFLAASKHPRALHALCRLYELTEHQNSKLAELMCSFDDSSVVAVVQLGLMKLLDKLSITLPELSSYLRGIPDQSITTRYAQFNKRI